LQHVQLQLHIQNLLRRKAGVHFTDIKSLPALMGCVALSDMHVTPISLVNTEDS
jgi:hypothetical protein